MQITIDTKHDSAEEIKHVARLLNSVVGGFGRKKNFYSNIPEDIIHSPFEPQPQQQKSGYIDFFEQGTNSTQNLQQNYPSQNFQGYQQPAQQPHFTPVDQMFGSQDQSAQQPIQQQPSSLFDLFDNTSTTQAAEKPEEKEEQIQIIEY